MRSEDLNDEIDRRYGTPAGFWREVKARLWDAGISQTALANEAGYNLGNMNRWLNGRKLASLRVMLAVDEALERLLEDR
jgi:hypothetical protein